MRALATVATVLGSLAVAVPAVEAARPNGPDVVPRGPRAERALARQEAAQRLVSRAILRVEAAQPSCRSRTATDPVPETLAGPPSALVLGSYGVFRRPATPADAAAAAAAARRPSGLGGGGVYLDFVRSVPLPGGASALVYPSLRGATTITPPSTACLDREQTTLRRLARHVAADVRATATRQFARYRRSAARDQTLPGGDAIGLFLRDADGSGGGGIHPATDALRRGAFSSFEDHSGARLLGLVPDGVATVTLHFPKRISRGRYYQPTVYPRALTRTVAVRDDLVYLHVDRGGDGALPRRVVWRAADGHVIRTID